jgi:hypothetical protein
MFDNSSMQNLQKKSPAPYGSNEKDPGSSQVFGFASTETFAHLYCLSFLPLPHSLDFRTAELCRWTTYWSDVKIPRRTVMGSGSNIRLLLSTAKDLHWMRDVESFFDAVLYLATFSFAKNRRAVSGMANDCKLCSRLKRTHSRILESSLLIPSLDTPLNIQSHAILKQRCSVPSMDCCKFSRRS